VARTSDIVPGLATGYVGGPTWRRATHEFPLHGEAGLVSTIRDLSKWALSFGSNEEVIGKTLADAMLEEASFPNGRINAYARGLGIRTHRGARLIEHGGLLPGFKTAFTRLPDRQAALICMTNDGGADPHAIAQKMIDGLLDCDPAGRPCAPRPDPQATLGLEGRWLDGTTGATVDIDVHADGSVQVVMYGAAFEARARPDGAFEGPTSFHRFRMRLLAADELEVERDPGELARYRRIETRASLPTHLDGRYANPDTAATWTIDGNAVHVSGPLFCRAQFRLEPVEGDFVRILAPAILCRSWFDALILRGSEEEVVGLSVDGARVRGLIFARVS
jgi:hypothetical protein